MRLAETYWAIRLVPLPTSDFHPNSQPAIKNDLSYCGLKDQPM